MAVNREGAGKSEESSPVRSARGFWALGEAVVDAVATRYPAAFDRQTSEDVG